MASTNPIIALILALSMFLSPAAGLQDSETSEIPYITATLTSVDGMNVSAGYNTTISGQPVVYFDANGIGLAMTGSTGYLSTEDGVISVPVADLIKLVTDGAPVIPEPTEEDATALMYLVQGVLGNITPGTLAVSMMPNGFSFTADVDKLCAELHTVVPSVLVAYAAYLDPTIQKYSTAILGETLTAAQLAQLWPELDLNEVQTGLSVQMTVLEMSDALSIIGSVSGVNFMAKISDESFSVSVSTPDGENYVVDSADIETVLQILDTATQQISDAAFSSNSERGYDEEGYRTVVTTTKVNTEALATDLNRGLAYAIALNASKVDELLNKYRSWITLLDEDLASMLNAAVLMQAFNNGMITLPAETGELVVITGGNGNRTTVDGYFANMTLTGSIFENGANSDINLVLTCEDRYEPLTLTFDAFSDRNGTTCSLSSSVPVLDLFSTINFSYTDNYDTELHLSTDTNFLRMDYSDEETYLDLKIAELFFTMYAAGDYDMHFGIRCPEFAATLRNNLDNWYFDSTIGGVDIIKTRSGMTVNGYLNDHWRYPTTFGATFIDSYYSYNSFSGGSYSSGSFSGYVNSSDGSSMSVSCTEEAITLIFGEQKITIRPLDMDRYDQAALAIEVDDEHAATLVLTETETRITFDLYQGSDLTVGPYYTLTLDAAPSPYAEPLNATPVDPMTFLMEADDLF